MRIILGFLLLFLPLPALAADIAFLVIDHNSYLANMAVEGMEADLSRRIRVVSSGELVSGGETLRREIEQAKVIVVDVMGRELEEYLVDRIDLQGKTIYALRGSQDDQELRKKGFRFDEEVAIYYRHLSRENIENMMRLVIHRHLDSAVSFTSMRHRLELGLYHPDAPDHFQDVTSFFKWQAVRPGHDPKRPRLGLLFYSAFLTPGQQEPIDFLIRRLETAGFSVLPCFGNDQQAIESFLLDADGKARVDIVLAPIFCLP